MLRCLLICGLLIVSGTAAAGGHDSVFVYDPQAEVPPLFPGSKNPLKKWAVEPIADGVYGFRYTFYRTIFIVSDTGVIVADPLNDQAAEILHTEIRRLTDLPIRYVAYSHSHWDHASGGRVFAEQGAQVVAQQTCAEQFIENSNPDIVLPDITYTDRYEIALGNKALELFYFGPSHDSCMVVMLIKPANLLFMVDLANPPDGWAMFYNPAVSEDRVWHMVPFFTRVQQLVEERNIKGVIGAHMTMGKDPVTGKVGIIPGTLGPSSVIAERLAFWSALIEIVAAELAAGTAPEQVPERLVEQRALAERISGYDPVKMRILLQRITSYAVTGE